MIRTTATMMIVLATGCGTSSDQRVTGKVLGATFPSAITSVRAVGTAGTIEAAVAADGAFTLQIPARDRYRIELHAATRKSDLVFPRATGAIDATFYVESARAAIDLGRVRYVLDPANTPYDHGGCKTHPEGGNVCVEDGDGGGGGECGADVGAPEGVRDPGAVPEKNPPAAIGCGGDGDGDGGDHDEGGGGHDQGGGGQDTGQGGGG